MAKKNIQSSPPNGGLLHVRTESGLSLDIEKEKLNDWRFVKALNQIKRDDVSALPDFLDSFLDEEQQARLFEHVKTEDGRVPIDAVVKEIGEILKAMGDEAKN